MHQQPRPPSQFFIKSDFRYHSFFDIQNYSDQASRQLHRQVKRSMIYWCLSGTSLFITTPKCTRWHRAHRQWTFTNSLDILLMISTNARVRSSKVCGNLASKVTLSISKLFENSLTFTTKSRGHIREIALLSRDEETNTLVIGYNELFLTLRKVRTISLP